VLAALEEVLDKRLVRTTLGLLQAMLLLRHNRYGLLLSELGGYLLGPEHAPAGTKRISNLLRSPDWDHQLIDRHLWQLAEQRVASLQAAQSDALVVWDDSVVEKPESLVSEGLCAVRSSKAQRLKRIKPGYYNPPTARPIFVPGFQWLAVMVVGMAGAPTLAAMRWWTRRGERATDQVTVAEALLTQCAKTWGRTVLHLFDRGYGSGPWLGRFLQADIRFVVRWRNSYHLLDAKGSRSPGDMCRGQRSLDERMLWDARRRAPRKVGLLYFPVAHPQFPGTILWLVVARPKGHPAWHFLTNQPIQTKEDAWRIVLAYRRRWQVETAFRFLKSELAIESPRLWFWQNRLKLFALVALVYAFLVSLLVDRPLLDELFTAWCHRTGKRHRLAAVPLYRLRSAIVRLWLAYPTPLRTPSLNSG
jgi:hypothetical protein